MTIDQFNSNVSSLTDRIENASKGILAEVVDKVVQINKKRIPTGKKANGESIVFLHPRKTPVSGAYTRAYSNYKSKRGGNTAFVDLKVDGTFIESIGAEAVDSGIKVTFDDDAGKVKGILGGYGDGFIGVNPAEIKDLKLKEPMIDAIRKILLNGL